MSLPSPAVLLGLPSSSLYSRWYEGQGEIFSQAMDWYHGSSRFLGIAAPTGSGKSVLATTVAKMTGARTIILTATKALQIQYLQDLSALGGVSVTGQNNFNCPLVPTLRADEGPCHDGMACSYSSRGDCPYRAQLAKAISSQIVVTNYAYYLAQTRFSSGLGEVGLVCLDEGHLAFSALENHLTVFLSKIDVEPLGIHFPADVEQWKTWQGWAETSQVVVEGEVERLDASIKPLRASLSPVPAALSRSFRSAKSVLHRLESMSQALGPWVIQRTHSGFMFTPRWVSNYGGLALFQSVPKVILMSAILSHKTADILGVPVAPARSWIEVGSYFPPQNTPIWHIPTTRVNYHTDDYGTTIWVARIDQIIQRRLDRKGIIFTVSYARAQLLLQRSRYANLMFTHSTGDVVSVVNKFKAAPAPAILVSPSVTTGFDFPEDTCRYIILGKVAYPDTTNPVMLARHEDDKDWSSYLAMETTIQSAGRGTRSSTDKCEVLAVDDNFQWFISKYRSFAPKWFLDRWRGSLQSVPAPLV